MKKENRLKKKMFKVIMIVFAVIFFLSGVLYYIYSNSEEKEKEKTTLEMSMRQQRNRLAQLEQKFEIYESSFSAYMEINRSFEDGNYSLVADHGAAILGRLIKRHRLNNLRMKIGSKQELVNQSSEKYTGFKPVFREVEVIFSALTDLHVYAFIDNIKKIFPGVIQETSVKISRKRPFSREVIIEVSRGSLPEVVEANITFLWMGIDQKKESVNASPY